MMNEKFFFIRKNKIIIRDKMIKKNEFLMA